jgi:hypothetical protein
MATSEYNAKRGDHGIPRAKRRNQLTPSERARLQRLVGVEDPELNIDCQVWNGQKRI